MLDVLCLAFTYARQSKETQNLKGFVIEDCLREAGLGWKCFGNVIKIENFSLLTANV